MTSATEQVWRPNPGPQTRFLASVAFEALYGGAAGGGKSDALLMGALRFIHHPAYQAIIFRRTFPELEKSLIPRSLQYFSGIPGARYNEQKKTWTFDSGAKVMFGHLEHDSSVLEHRSAEYQYIGFDELTTFTRHQYVYLLSRARSAAGIPIRIRSATNPGGEGHGWVMERWAPWLDRRDSYAGPRAQPDQPMYYRPEIGGEEWVPRGTPGSFSRVFFPAKLADNPKLMEKDPEYANRLKAQDEQEAKQLLEGDWLTEKVKGALWEASYFDHHRVREAPELVRVAVAVDPAVTAEEGSDETGIVAGGVSASGHVYVLEDLSDRYAPEVWGRQVISLFNRREANVIVGEVNNGGDLVRSNIQMIDASMPFMKVWASRGKQARAEPVSTLYKNGRVHHVGVFPKLERECKTWVPGVTKRSPNRLDALVWLVRHLVPAVHVELPEQPAPSVGTPEHEAGIEEAAIADELRRMEEESDSW